MSTFGELLKTDRERLQLSQEQLAERLGVSQQAVANWENGTSHPRKDRRALLLEILGPNSELTKNPPRYDFIPVEDQAPVTRTLPDFTIGTLKGAVNVEVKTTGIISRAMVGSPSVDFDAIGTEPRPYLFSLRRNFLEKLRAELPEPLRKNVDQNIGFGQRVRTYEYVSTGVIARAMQMPGNPDLLVGRAARHVIHLGMASRRHDMGHEPSATNVLFILSEEPEVVLKKRIDSLTFDANQLGVAISVAPTAVQVASAIVALEELYANQVREFNGWMHDMHQAAMAADDPSGDIFPAEPDLESDPPEKGSW